MKINYNSKNGKTSTMISWLIRNLFTKDNSFIEKRSNDSFFGGAFKRKDWFASNPT